MVADDDDGREEEAFSLSRGHHLNEKALCVFFAINVF